MRIKILLTILLALFIFTSCEQDAVTIETTDFITSETMQETTETTTEAIETMPPDIVPQTTDIINILKHSGNSPDKLSSSYDLLYDTCGYIQLDLTDLDPSIIYADGKFYRDNLLIGSINPTITDENISVTDLTAADILPENINAGKITYAFELPPMKQPKKDELVYEAYLIDSENYYIHFPLINDNSPEIYELNLKARDEFFAEIIENRDTILAEMCAFYFNSIIIGDCVGITIDQSNFHNPYSFEGSFYNTFDYSIQYYYNLKEKRLIDFDEYLWHGLMLQLNSDEFYETYFANYIERDYVITREADQVKIIPTPVVEYDENEPVPAVPYNNNYMTLSLNLKNTIPIEISVVNHRSKFNSNLFTITTDKPFDPKKYPVADKPNEIINTAYSHTFTTKYDDVINGTYYNNFNVPQINSDKPEAIRLNQEIIDYMFNGNAYYEEFKLIEMNRGDCMNTVVHTRDYIHFIEGNILVIKLYKYAGLLGSDSFTEDNFIYYDYTTNREVTCEDYLKQIGYTMQDIVDILNSALLNYMYGNYTYYYGEEGKIMTPDDIGGVYKRDDGTLEIMIQINSYYGGGQFVVTAPYHEEDGFQFFAYKRMVNLPNYYYDKRGKYTGFAVGYPNGETGYHNIQSDIPYTYYLISDTESAALGVTETTIELSTVAYYTIVVNIDDILRHHSADTKYENVTAKITGVTDNKLTIAYEIDSISGTIYFDYITTAAYFEDNEDKPFYVNNATDYIKGSEFYLPQKMLSVSLDIPYEFYPSTYTFKNNIERLDSTGFTVYNFTNPENQTPESMLAAADFKMYSQKNIISDNLMTCTVLSVYEDGENISEYTNGYVMIYINDDTAFFIASDDYTQWNDETYLREVVYGYDEFVKFAESIEISRG